MAMVEDMAAFLDAADFAEVATFRNVAINGILDLSYVSPFDVEAVAKPAFICAAASVEGVAIGEELRLEANERRLNAVNYSVTGVVPDGTGPGGMVTLELRLV